MWGYACDKARNQGFKSISIMYWLENDPNRPANWEPKHTPGPISVYSQLCDMCQNITLQEYFDLLQGFVLRHDYRFHGGAGSHYNMCKRFEGDFNSYTICANCRKECQSDGYCDHYSKDFQAGYIVVGGLGSEFDTGGSLSFCPDCPKKLKIKELKPIYKHWNSENNKKDEIARLKRQERDANYYASFKEPEENTGYPDDDCIGSD